MEKQARSLTLDLAPGVCIWLALAMLVVPLRWLLSWLLAAAVHELFHYAMILLTGGCVRHIRIGAFGAEMEARLNTWAGEVLCAAAGPCGGLCLLLLARWMPRLALCGFVQSVYNLIPVYPLDGGRVLGGLIHRLAPGRAERIIKWTETAVLCLIGGVCVYAVVFLELGILPVILAASVILRTGKIKIPCKAGPLRVQ